MQPILFTVFPSLTFDVENLIQTKSNKVSVSLKIICDNPNVQFLDILHNNSVLKSLIKNNSVLILNGEVDVVNKYLKESILISLYKI